MLLGEGPSIEHNVRREACEIAAISRDLPSVAMQVDDFGWEIDLSLAAVEYDDVVAHGD
jgi:hypothetical protein